MPRFEERRASVRCELLSCIQGELDTFEIFEVTNISAGGMHLRTQHDFRIGEIHEFRLAHSGAGRCTFAARVVHVTRRADGLSGVGVAFAGEMTSRRKAFLAEVCVHCAQGDASREE